MKRVLIIEDDEGIADFVLAELKHEGFFVDWEKTGRRGLEKATDGNFDIVLLDVMLPEMNGLEVLRRLREKSNVPVILETARGETIDKINGLNSGADDYIAKPFEIEELLARMNAVLRRSSFSKDETILRVRSIELNVQNMSASVNSIPLNLSKTEFLMLKTFLENAGKVLSRDKIIDDVWGIGHTLDLNTVDVYVGYLRSKIGAEQIQTVRGSGFILVGE